MQYKVIKYALSRCRVADFRHILHKSNFLTAEEISDIDLKKSKLIVINELIKRFMKKDDMNEDRAGELDLICNHFYSTKKTWSVYHLQGQKRNGTALKSSLLSDPQRFKKRLEREMGSYLDTNKDKHHNYSVSSLMIKGVLWVRVYFPGKPAHSLVPSNAVYLVYHPQSPYIIISRIKKSHEKCLIKVLMQVLGYSQVSNMQLTGRHVDALAELACNKQSQGSFSKYRLNQVQGQPLSSVGTKKRKEPDYDDSYQIVCEDEAVKRRRTEILDNTFGPNEQPTLEKLEYRVEVKFRGTSNAPGMAGKEDPFRCRVKFEGPAVLEGIKNLCECGLATVPLPHHLGGVPSMAKNHFVLADQSQARQNKGGNTSVSDHNQSR